MHNPSLIRYYNLRAAYIAAEERKVSMFLERKKNSPTLVAGLKLGLLTLPYNRIYVGPLATQIAHYLVAAGEKTFVSTLLEEAYKARRS